MKDIMIVKKNCTKLRWGLQNNLNWNAIQDVAANMGSNNWKWSSVCCKNILCTCFALVNGIQGLELNKKHINQEYSFASPQYDSFTFQVPVNQLQKCLTPYVLTHSMQYSLSKFWNARGLTPTAPINCFPLQLNTRSYFKPWHLL